MHTHPSTRHTSVRVAITKYFRHMSHKHAFLHSVSMACIQYKWGLWHTLDTNYSPVCYSLLNSQDTILSVVDKVISGPFSVFGLSPSDILSPRFSQLLPVPAPVRTCVRAPLWTRKSWYWYTPTRREKRVDRLAVQWPSGFVLRCSL